MFTLEHENETYYCVFPGNNEVMLYQGQEGLFSYLNLTDNFTSIHRQKAIQITDGLAYMWIPGRFPEPLGNSNDLAPILEKLQPNNLPPELEKPTAILERYPYENDLTIHRLKKLPQKPAIWEALQFLTPPKIWDNELDCELLTVATLITHHQDIMFQQVASYKDANLQKIPNQLAENFLERGYLPEALHVEDPYLEALLQDFCQQLGITCEIAPVPSAQLFKDRLLGKKTDPLEEALRYLEHLGAQISQQMSLPSEEIPHLLEILMYMGLQHKQLPPNWNPEPIQVLLEERPDLAALLIKFLQFAKETSLIKEADSLLELVIRTKIF